jgi:hypothetical protein
MPASPDVRTLSWPHGLLQVHALGGMIGPASFLLPNGRQVAPLHVAPWWNEPAAQSLDGLTRGLRGEWPCVPFGYPMPKAEFPADWQAVMDDAEEISYAHGFGSHHPWTFRSAPGADRIEMQIDYPADHDVERLERSIVPDPDGAAIDVMLTIHVRRPCRLPVAFHGCFALPDVPGAVGLVPGRFSEGVTHPATVEPGAALFVPDRTFTALDAVPTRGGGTQDATHLPFDRPVEELLQLNGSDGSFALINRHDGYRVDFTWDSQILPSVLLWYSNRGRAAYPWSSRNLNIGIEPTASAYGLSPRTSAADNPIAHRCTPTAVALDPTKPTKLRYRLAVSASEQDRAV